MYSKTFSFQYIKKKKKNSQRDFGSPLFKYFHMITDTTQNVK